MEIIPIIVLFLTIVNLDTGGPGCKMEEKPERRPEAPARLTALFRRNLLMIRPARAEDLPAILDIYAPYVRDTTVSFEYAPPTAEEFARRFETVTARFPWLVWERQGRILGYAYASAPFDRAAYSWCAEATVYLAPQARGQGVARALYEALEPILEAQGYQVLYALVCGENRASLRFHEKMGYLRRAVFPRCGYKHGRWLDMIWMEKTLKIVDNPREFPVPWLEIVQTDEI